MVGSLEEEDYIWFDLGEEPWGRLCFLVNYVDNQWAYLKQVGATSVEFKINKETGVLRFFDGMGWEIIEGKAYEVD